MNGGFGGGGHCGDHEGGHNDGDLGSWSGCI